MSSGLVYLVVDIYAGHGTKQLVVKGKGEGLL
jgi:hypothetical protein